MFWNLLHQLFVHYLVFTTILQLCSHEYIEVWFTVNIRYEVDSIYPEVCDTLLKNYSYTWLKFKWQESCDKEIKTNHSMPFRKEELDKNAKLLNPQRNIFFEISWMFNFTELPCFCDVHMWSAWAETNARLIVFSLRQVQNYCLNSRLCFRSM